MKRLLLNIIFFISYYLGFISFFYFITRKRQRIITFHNVIPDIYFDNSLCLGVSCSESVFDFQLKQIANKYAFTTDLQKQKSCIITFDDGYKNNYKIALPILEKYGAKAIFFITYDLVNKQKTLWIDLILKWCSYVPIGTYNIDGLKLKLTNENRLDIFQSIYSFVFTNYTIKEDISHLLNDKFPFPKLLIDSTYDALRFTALSIEEIEDMKKQKYIIACHTISHDILSKLSNVELADEILSSEKYLEKFYNSDYFSYPFGGVNEVSETVLKSYSVSKFKKCFVNYWNFKNDNRDESMQRMSLPNTTNKYVIHAYLSGFYFFLKKKIIHE
jgi:peptidoglycan/xylan/chitin deacetylase (PgdA/CDA1 family)